MATPDYVLMRIRSLEEQIRGLRSLVSGLTRPTGDIKGLGEVYGIWRGKVHFPDEEIEKAKTDWMKPLSS